MIKTEMLTSPEDSELFMFKVFLMEAEKKLAEDSKPFINIKLQNGPIKECGVNGCQIDAIILFCRDKIFEFNNILACHENETAIYHLTQALFALKKRTLKRELRGVEGTSLE